MCIIVAKNKNVEMPSMKTLMTCFENNPDGAGIMYAFDNKVHIKKGFMSFDQFEKALKSISIKTGKTLDELPIVMHFRISTRGNVDGGNCHPFPIGKPIKLLRQTSIKCDVGMAHNGVLHNWEPDKKSIYNDTQTFVNECVNVLYDGFGKDFLNNTGAYNLIDHERGTSRLCFLESDGTITCMGNWETDNGVMYSNDSYIDYFDEYGNEYGYGNYNYYNNINEDSPQLKRYKLMYGNDEGYDEYLSDYEIVLDRLYFGEELDICDMGIIASEGELIDSERNGDYVMNRYQFEDYLVTIESTKEDGSDAVATVRSIYDDEEDNDKDEQR